MWVLCWLGVQCSRRCLFSVAAVLCGIPAYCLSIIDVYRRWVLAYGFCGKEKKKKKRKMMVGACGLITQCMSPSWVVIKSLYSRVCFLSYIPYGYPCVQSDCSRLLVCARVHVPVYLYTQRGWHISDVISMLITLADGGTQDSSVPCRQRIFTDHASSSHYYHIIN